jgi:hypothetical protein
MTTKIEQITSGIEYYGYTVSMEPISGLEDVFTQTLRDALAKIESTLADCNKAYGTRGTSKRAISNLHNFLPEPAWGVELAA